MPRPRKGTPEPAGPEPAPVEDTPPAPPPREGEDKNPELKKRRTDVAKGIWDPKRSAEIAKQLPSDKLVATWAPVGEMFATMTDVIILVLFGPKEAMKNLGALSEREMVVQAWAARLAVEPPENIKSILTVNLVAVYCFIFLPRIQRVWVKPEEELEPCVAKTIKKRSNRGGQRKEGKDDHGDGGGPKSPQGDAGRRDRPEGEAEGSRAIGFAPGQGA